MVQPSLWERESKTSSLVGAQLPVLRDLSEPDIDPCTRLRKNHIRQVSIVDQSGENDGPYDDDVCVDMTV